jgi:hypothetical protein
MLNLKTVMGRIFRADRGIFAAGTVPAEPRRMVERVMMFKPADDLQALKLLRAGFPDRPLSGRVAALDFLMRRSRGSSIYRPR